jgi:predicted GH43/DUF377 family glycosyl hydrolase
MIKIKREACLVTPLHIVPSLKEFRVLGAINPAAVRLPNRDILLYVRVIERLITNEDEKHYFSPRFVGSRECKIKNDVFLKRKVKSVSELDFLFNDGTKRLVFISHFRKVILAPDGFTVKKIDKKPTFFGLKNDGELAVEDPRITLLEDGRYLMTYVTLARERNVSTSYATSRDLKHWKREGIIFREQNKDVVIFPEKIKGKYFAINRPEGSFQFTNPDMCIAESADLNHWGKQTEFGFRKKKRWDSGRVGAGPPPIKTKKGWLLIYHGVIEKDKRVVYAVGSALLDLTNPRKMLAKTNKPMILPSKDYEKGDLEKKEVVFPTGLVLHENGEDVLIYSGGGDVNTTVKQVSLKEIMRAMKRF